MNILDVEKSFFGRKQVLGLLKKRLLGLKEGYRQNIALLGDPLLGKTTIINKFISDLEDNDVIRIYLDLENKDFVYFCHKYCESILYYYLKLKALPVHEDLKLLVESCKRSLPRTVKEIEWIQSDLQHHKWLDAYRRTIALPEVFTNETNSFCLIVIDEFQNLEEMGIPHVFQELGKTMMTQKRTLYVVTSSYPEIAKRIFSEKLSLLFGNFEMVPVETFDVKSSQEFIRHKLGSIKMGEDLQNFLIDFTAGHPLYLNLILQKLMNLSLMHKQEEVFSPIVIQAIENTLFDKWSLIGRQFDLIMQELCAGKGNRLFAPILIALADHKLKLKDLAKQLNMRQALFSPKINRLLESGIIEKHGYYFCIKDKLFRYWIKYILHKKLKTIEPNVIKLKSDFAEEINQLINNFRSNSTKDLSLRVKELLSCFDNESFNINGRRYKLPLFHEITPWVCMRSATQDNLQIIRARCEEGTWFIVFKPGLFTEGDIHLFLKELRRREEKPFKCVMISLSELDPNARLKALQERVWIWHEEELKMFLNFYDKPFIIGTYSS